jgi:dihydroorotate dehydrogenase
MYSLIRPLLFKIEPERAHALTLSVLRFAGSLPPALWLLDKLYAAPEKPVEAFGLKFRNPVGLAAGYDKNAFALHGLAALGFGHIEVGTVTPRPQPGNPKPRMFRLVEDEAIINRLGFPGKGADRVAENVQMFKRPNVVLGVNLGKNKDTPLEEAEQDYLELMRRFMALANYLTINVSSPNTAGLRRLQGREMLESLLGAVAEARREIVHSRGGNAPILVKLAPDLSDEELDDAIGVILDKGMDGVIATNTTLRRDGLKSGRQSEAGGLSGRPLGGLSGAMLKKIVKRVDGRLPVVSAGGIMSPGDARARLDAGASLVQIYTGLVYQGPGLVKAIVRNL